MARYSRTAAARDVMGCSVRLSVLSVSVFSVAWASVAFRYASTVRTRGQLVFLPSTSTKKSRTLSWNAA